MKLVKEKMVILNVSVKTKHFQIKSGRHQMLSKLSSRSIASLRKLDDEANEFYDRNHDLYQTAFLTL